MEEKSFFEYHLYTLTRPTTIRDAETKQIEMVSGAGIRLRRAYVYDPPAEPHGRPRGQRVQELPSERPGQAAAQGRHPPVRPGPRRAGDATYRRWISTTRPSDESIRLPWGYAFDIGCSATQTNQRSSGDTQDLTWTYEVRNHKPYDVAVTVIVHVPPSTMRAQCATAWHVRDTQTVEIPLAVQAGGTQTVTFEYVYNPVNGGGLKSPYDK